MKNKSGNCALTTAIRLNDLEILKVLLDNKADVNTQNKSSQTPIFVAAFNNQVEVVHLLLQYNPNIKTPDSRGWNALMVAANKGFIEIIRLLLYSTNCDLFQRNLRGETVFELAKNKEVLDVIIENCGYEICEIEGNLGNSIMCGIRAKMNCQNNSLYHVQNSQFDAGSFYTKEVKRVQSNFKSICENNHQQLNKLKSGLANLSNGILKKQSKDNNHEKLFLSENKQIMNSNSNKQQQHYANSMTSQKVQNVGRIDKESPQISSFRYENQNIQMRNSDVNMSESAENKSGGYVKHSSQVNNIMTPSKYNSKKSVQSQNMSTQSQVNRNTAIPSSSGYSSQQMSVPSQGKHLPSAISLQQYTSNASITNSNSHKKVSSFVVSEELTQNSFYSQNQQNNETRPKGLSGEAMSDLAQPYEDKIIESDRFKEIEDDFLKKSNSELIQQFKTQLMTQIKSLIPNITSPLFIQYENSINYFIEHLIYNINLTNVQKILVLMQFQSQILIDILQQQNQLLIVQQTKSISSSSNASQITNLPHKTSIEVQGKSLSSVDRNEQLQNQQQVNYKQQNSRSSSSSNLSQIKKNQLDIINSNDCREQTKKVNSSPSQQPKQPQKQKQQQKLQQEYQQKKQQQQQQQQQEEVYQQEQKYQQEQPTQSQHSAIKEKYYQNAKNKYFQMDGIIEQPTLEMIETPRQCQQQDKKIVLNDNIQLSFRGVPQQQNIESNNASDNNNLENQNDSFHTLITTSSPIQISDDYDMISTVRDSLKDNSQKYHQNHQGSLNTSQRESNIKERQNNSQKEPSLSQFFDSHKQFNNSKGIDDFGSSGQYDLLSDKCQTFDDKLHILNCDDMIHYGKYNTIESSSQGVTNFFNSNKKGFTSIENDAKYDFEEGYDDNKELTQNGQFDLNDVKQEEERQPSSSGRDKHLFQKVHVFNGNKCQVVMSSAQASKSQSEIDYDISLSNSGFKNQINYYKDNHNKINDIIHIDDHMQEDTQQMLFNQFEYITDGLTDGDFHIQSKQKITPSNSNNEDSFFLYESCKFSEGFIGLDDTNGNQIHSNKQDKKSIIQVSEPMLIYNQNKNRNLEEINNSSNFSNSEVNQSPQFYQNLNISPLHPVSQFTSPSTTQNQAQENIHQSTIERLETMQKTLNNKISQIQMKKQQTELKQQESLNKIKITQNQK